MYVCGMMPFMMFSEVLNNSADAVVKNVHLVKKTIFPTEVLPAVQLLASLVGHGIMLGILVTLMAFHGIPFSLYNVQSLYYLFALSVLCLGMSWFLASVNVFCRDLGHVLKVVLNVWFWATPIVWPLEIMPDSYRSLLKLNPLLYIVEGYRNSLLYQIPLWNDCYVGLYYWMVSLGLLILGGVVFRKLKPGFGDVL
jgi:lipopolysaccharide transport system permease protein/teichoic acid transport system permease protein